MNGPLFAKVSVAHVGFFPHSREAEQSSKVWNLSSARLVKKFQSYGRTFPQNRFSVGGLTSEATGDEQKPTGFLGLPLLSSCQMIENVVIVDVRCSEARGL